MLMYIITQILKNSKLSSYGLETSQVILETFP